MSYAFFVRSFATHFFNAKRRIKMNLKIQFLKENENQNDEILGAFLTRKIADKVCDFTLKTQINADEEIFSWSLEMLKKIREYICDETSSDFEIVENIYNLFIENGISCKNIRDY